jgi:DNA-binding XRE family transcriptional regulator/transposase
MRASEVPYGYCHCGCGRKAPISTKTRTRYGHVKGEPVQFLRGHSQRIKEHQERVAQMPGPNPSGLCKCGCNNPTPIARQTDTALGWVKGKPISYIQGHRPRRLTPDQEAEICQRYEAGENVPALAKTYDVPASTLYELLKRRNIPRRSNRSLSDEQEAEVCVRYQAGERADVICEDFSINKSTVRQILKRNGVPMTGKGGPPRKFSASQEAEMCRRYEAGENAYGLARDFGTNRTTVCQVLERHGVPRRSVSEAKRIYSCDHSFFQRIDSEPKAYWLGFIAADGGVYKNALQVTLSSKDREHLLKLKADLHSDHPLRDNAAKDRRKSYANTGASSVFYLRSPQIIEGLTRHGVMPCKTFKLKWPNFLPDELLRHYLRGYFEGDGCFSITGGSYVRKRDGQRLPALSWSIVGTEAFCLGAQEYLVAAASVSRTRVSPCRPGMSTYRLIYGGLHQVSRIYRLLYDGTSVYLPRKREVARPHVRSGLDVDLNQVNPEELKRIRKKQGMRAEDLANKAGISASTVSSIETGKAPARSGTVERLARAVGIEPSQLIAGG